MMNKTYRKSIIVITFFILSMAAALVVNDYFELKEPGIIVLLYHRITNEESGNKYDVSVKKFMEQLDYLRKEGYSTIVPHEINRIGNSNNLNMMVILSFDDGSSDHFNVVYKALSEKGFRGVFFVIVGGINAHGRLKENQIIEMSQNNMEIGSHSVTHPLLDTLSYNAIYHELKQSKDDIERVTGKNVTSFAPPGGWFNDDVIRAAKAAGYEAVFGCEIGVNDIRKRLLIYKRIEVLGSMSIDDFKQLLDPPQILSYKIRQTLKFMLHNIIGSRNYERLANATSG